MVKKLRIALPPALFLFILSVVPGFSQDAGAEFRKGSDLYQQGLYGEALPYFIKSADLFSKYSGKNDQSAYALLWAGLTEFSQQHYTDALPLFQEAFTRASERGFPDAALSAMIYKGQIYMYLGKYDLGFDHFKTAEVSAEVNNLTIYFPSIYQGLGDISFLWAKYDEALAFYNQGISYAKPLGYEENIIALKQAIGKTNIHQGKTDKAAEIFQDLLLRPNIEGSGSYGSILNNLGIAYMYQGKNQKAMDVYSQALEEAERNNNKALQSQLLVHIGGIYHIEKKFPQALEQYSKSLSIKKETGIIADQAAVLANMGEIYREQGEYQKAVPYFQESIRIKNKLRQTAAGRDRIDYLSSEIKTYQRLIWTLALDGRIKEAFNTAETSTAKYLTEQLNRNLPDDIKTTVNQFQNELKENQVYIRFVVSSLPEHLVFLVDSDSVHCRILDQTRFDDAVSPAKLKQIVPPEYESRGLTVQAVPEKEAIPDDAVSFDQIVRYFYFLHLDTRRDDELQRVGRILYDYLLGPLQSELKDTQEIIFSLDGILHFIPIETLVTAENKYMAEKYCLSYVPSAVSAQLIKNRNFPSTRKDLIAFGGAVYEDESVPSVYSELGIKSWQPLPGSLEEVKEIGELFSDSNVYTGTQATESKIKELSKEKSLAAYKIIHLAAHGLILPETPELSAVVLSQGSRFNSREHGMDGYLSMQEILDLDLAADFVNLSACETGLGRLYGGEGIVGLTQAVILAGAKSVSASLWQVADKSTAAFMAGVYRLVLESGISYKEAITEIKRQFIRSENYSHPFFWAPFVYYGM